MSVAAGGVAQQPPDVSGRPMTPEERKVIFASSLGTVFEWYDFYIFGTLAAVVGKQFFAPLSTTAQFIMTLLAFAAGFAVRPFGAVIFGRIGDIVGRKYTFLITITIMGTSTFLIGLLPGYTTWGIAAPVILISLRLLQGLALGGEYGGAATYVAEHAPHGRRGYFTSWIQTTATVGLFMALLVILGTRTWVGEDAFANSGWWRLPFLLSFFLLIISVWIRLSLNESPAFARMKKAGRTSKAPLTESFGRLSNAKIVVLALLGGTAGQAVVWYCGQFYALFFLTQSLKVDPATANLMIAASLLIGTPFFIVFGSLSDKIGRKKIIMAGCLLAVLTYFPLFHGLTHYANPALEAAHATAPAVVVSDPATCSIQFNPVGTAKFTTPCDLAKSTLATSAVQYTNEAAPPGSPTVVKFGADQQADGDRDPHDPGHLRDDGVRPDRGDAGGAVSDPDPLHLAVAAVSHRQRLVRRLPARDLVCDRGRHRQHLRRAVVPDHRGGDDVRDRYAVPAGNQGPRHLRGRLTPRRSTMKTVGRLDRPFHR